MRKIVLSTLMISAAIVMFTACKKEEDTPAPVATTTATPAPTPAPTSDPCNGDPGFCMDYGSVNKSGPAKLFVYNGSRTRVYWENGSGNSFEQIELDIEGLVAGTYNVDGLAIPGSSANVQYYSAAGGVVNPAYGTVVVSALDTINGVTGTFTVTMNDSTKITNGKFTSIVK
ncbi:MAG: hypothetical protein P8Q14_08085 [Vicingaceae bacterium]|nr:hypothetical protein [Vicingaceae bacterium]